MKKIIFICCLLLLSFLIVGCGDDATGNVVDSEGYLRISLSDLSEKVKFYSYNDAGVEISYFGVLGSDGKPRTAFDACDVCGGYKGYEQQGNDIMCRKCGRVFRIDGLGTKNKGYGCWPSYLPHEVKGNEILIKASSIKESRQRFV